jgi:hypothetical protein
MIGIGVVALHSFYYDDYLLRAAVTKLGFGANIAQEAFYPPTFTDSEGKTLCKALIHLLCSIRSVM